MVKWTEDQLRVIKTRNRNLLVSAAAGSGKTAVLVERIIQIVTDPVHPIDLDRLLIVTFTKAAAGEMKERIEAGLEKKLAIDEENLHLRRQISLLGRANITTIHSFCLNIIRANFNNIGLDPAFRIGDEAELTLLKSDCIDEVLEQWYERNHEAFLEFVECYSGHKTDTQLGELILSLFNFAISHPRPDYWLESNVDRLQMDTLEQLEESPWMLYLKQYIRQIFYELKEQVVRCIHICDEIQGPYMYKDALLSDIAQIDSLLGITTYVQYFDTLKTISFARLSSKRDENVSDDKKEEVKNIREGIKKNIKDLQNAFFFQEPNEMLLDIQKTVPSMKVLVELTLDFMQYYRQEKLNKNIVDFNDLEHFALEILGDFSTGDLLPTEIGRTMQNQFHEILVDEYQDSNLVQEYLLRSVSKEWEGAPNVFMVGDVKQSIYKFRMAKPELFMDKYKRYSKDESLYQRIDLHKNFRSRKEVLDGVNFLFSKMMSERLGDIDYNEDVALYAGAEYKERLIHESSIDVVLIDMAEEDDDTKDMALSNKEIEAKAISKKIKALVQGDNPYQVYDRNIGEMRPVRYGDIVILLRTMSEWSEVFVNNLLAEDIPAYAEVSTGYFDAIEVKLLLAMLTIIDNPIQDIPLCAVLKSPMGGFDTNDLAHIRSIDGNCNFYDCLLVYAKEGPNQEKREQVNQFLVQLSYFREQANYRSLNDLIWMILNHTGYYHYVLAMPGGTRRQANIQMLIERATQFEQSSFKGLFNFIRYIEKLKKYQIDFGEASILGENEDLVRIMSIHKSKGLEFPVVILAGTGKQFNQQDARSKILLHGEAGLGPDYIDYHLRVKTPTLIKKIISKQIQLENLSEELRVLYVALTRSKEKLIITGTIKKYEEGIKRFKSNEATTLDGKISFMKMISGTSYLDWIMPSLMQHPRIALCIQGNQEIKDEIFSFERYKLDRFVEEGIEVYIDHALNKDYFLEQNPNQIYNQEIRQALETKFQWKYPYEKEIISSAKLTVTELNKQMYHEEEALAIYEDTSFVPTIPKFMGEAKEALPVNQGVLFHKILQKIDFNLLESQSHIRQGLINLTEKGIIKIEDIKADTIYKLLDFGASTLGKRMVCAYQEGNLHREKQFMIGLLGRDLNTDISPDETILVQGIIDAYFFEDDELILVDYKTNHNLTEEMFIKLYGTQLGYYETALTQITGKKVQEKYIYSFALQKEIIIK